MEKNEQQDPEFMYLTKYDSTDERLDMMCGNLMTLTEPTPPLLNQSNLAVTHQFSSLKHSDTIYILAFKAA